MKKIKAKLVTAFNGKYNMATVPPNKARAYAEQVMVKAGKSLDSELPDFDKNYVLVQKALKKAKDISRNLMPVIEPSDMKEFHKALKTGHIDIFKPWVKNHFYAPEGLKPGRGGNEWIHLGIKDGEKEDDIIGAKWTSVAAEKLIPTQSQIWLDKIIPLVVKFGPATSGSPITKATIIVSKEGYILDGHHRYGQVMIADPSIKLSALYVPLPINILLSIGRSYGDSIGNQRKA